MAQFQIYSNNNKSTKDVYPYLIDVQSQILESLETRLVIPLVLSSVLQNKQITKLTPTISIKGKDHAILTSQMAGISKKHLGSFIVDVSDRRQELISAIDFLISGY
jgi:toxin CcdB